MAETEKFYEPQIDRTNYQAFWYVGVALIVLVSGSAYGLYLLGNKLRHVVIPPIPSIVLPKISTPDPQAALKAAENQANQDASKAADQAATKAADNVQNKLNQFLKP